MVVVVEEEEEVTEEGSKRPFTILSNLDEEWIVLGRKEESGVLKGGREGGREGGKEGLL